MLLHKKRIPMSAIEQKIQAVLNTEIKPMLAMHLGSLEYISFTDGIVKIRFQGTCVGCPLAQLTLKAGIEETLKSRIRAVKSVEAVSL